MIDAFLCLVSGCAFGDRCMSLEGLFFFKKKVNMIQGQQDDHLMTPGLNKDIWCHVCRPILFTMLAHLQIRHQGTTKKSSQLGDPSGVCVGMYGLKYSIYHSCGVIYV